MYIESHELMYLTMEVSPSRVWHHMKVLSECVSRIDKTNTDAKGKVEGIEEHREQDVEQDREEMQCRRYSSLPHEHMQAHESNYRHTRT